MAAVGLDCCEFFTFYLAVMGLITLHRNCFQVGNFDNFIGQPLGSIG
jgi:hypothetical protein